MDVTAMTSVHLVRKVSLSFGERLPRVTGLASYPSGCFYRQALDCYFSRVLGTGSAPVSGTSRVHVVLSLFALYDIKRSAFWQVPCQTVRQRTGNHGINRDLLYGHHVGCRLCNKSLS